jgi:flagellar biosynthesis/type III secretory pathway M-ring protein FliF/YscJ
VNVEFVLRRWNALDVRGRMLVAALACASIVATALALALQRDTRAALFAAPLRSEQVEEVAERLAEWNVPFVVTADNVRVDGGARNDLLLRLAMLGVPHTHLASLDDALGKAGPLTPQSVLDAQALEGRAGDLASGLRGVAGVEDARVIIAPARDGTFADDGSSHAATASVRLTLRPGAELSHATVDGLRAYVADGVPGLNPEHVAILDDRGFTFAEESDGASEGSALQTSLQSALDQALGGGATVVRVRVMLDASSARHREIVRQPLGGAIGSTSSDEHFKSATKQYTKSNATLDRGSDERDENVDTPPGRIERISVAVAVDAARGFDLAKIEALARATLALDSGRGDIVSVTSVPFPHAASVSRALPFLSILDSIASIVPSTLIALALFGAIRYGAKPFLGLCETFAQRVAVERTSRAVSGYAPAHVRGALANEPPHTAAAIISALPAATATAVLEMYSAEERAAIVQRMARAAAPAVPDYETVLRRA